MTGTTDWEKGLVQHGRALVVTHNVAPGDGTLQLALNAASAGDELVLADGTYTGSGSNVLEIDKDITIRALNPGQAALDGGNARRVIYITSGTVALNGLKVTKGVWQGVSNWRFEPSQTFCHYPAAGVSDVRILLCFATAVFVRCEWSPDL